MEPNNGKITKISFNGVEYDIGEKKEKKSFGYWLGYACCVVVVSCLMVAALALTVKLVTWLF